jgi:hypothetical protein
MCGFLSENPVTTNATTYDREVITDAVESETAKIATAESDVTGTTTEATTTADAGTTESSVTETTTETTTKETATNKTTKKTITKKINGWKKESGQWHYYKNSKKISKPAGFYFINSRWYRLSKKGSIVKFKTGWRKINKAWYYVKSNGKYYTGWKNIGSKKYYFGAKGKLTEGWFKKGKYEYYQTVKKGIYKNDVVKYKTGKKYYWLNDKGQKYDDKLTRYVVKIWVKCIKPNMTKKQKLRAMFDYLAEDHNSRFTYSNSKEYVVEDYSYMGTNGWTKKYALEMFSSGNGNCYRFACCFGYMAKMLGYDAYAVNGVIGKGGKHGWTELVIDGTRYICDPEMNYMLPQLNMYMQTYASYTNLKGMKATAHKRYKIKF